MNAVPKRSTPIGTLRVIARDEHMGRMEAIAEAVNEAMGPGSHTPTRERPCPEMRGRGVSLANFFDPGGNPVVQAVGADGRLVAWLPWPEGTTLAAVEERLWAILDVTTALR